MTKKRYPESKSLSRSRKIRQTRPFPDHYAAAQPPNTSEEHPVDLLIDAIPEIASRRRKLLRMAKRWQREAREESAYIGYEDLRLDYFTMRVLETIMANGGRTIKSSAAPEGTQMVEIPGRLRIRGSRSARSPDGALA